MRKGELIVIGGKYAKKSYYRRHVGTLAIIQSVEQNGRVAVETQVSGTFLYIHPEDILLMTDNQTASCLLKEEFV